MNKLDIDFKRNAKPGKRLRFSNYCLFCSDSIPADKAFCDNNTCENNFYDDSHLHREEYEAMAEKEDQEDDKRWEKQSKCFP